MILSHNHACTAYVSDWLEAFGIDGDGTGAAIDRRLTGYESVGVGLDEAADRTILTFLLGTEEPVRLAA